MYTASHNTFNQAYPDLIKAVMDQGVDLPSRVSACREIHPAVVEVSDPSQRLVTALGRPVNVAFALAEALWILQGREDVEMPLFYNSTIDKYSDNGRTFNAAYGRRLRDSFGHDQLKDVERLLKADPESRQATLVLSLPSKVRAYRGPDKNTTKDRACNVLAHVMIRDGQLDWMQVVRSNDAMWGTPYNWMQFSHLHEFLATRLEVNLGKYTHMVDSLHVYDYHWEEARIITGFDLYELMQERHASMEIVDDETMRVLANIEDGIRLGTTRDPNHWIGDYWESVIHVLRAHAEYKRGNDVLALEHLLAGDPVYGAAQTRFYALNRWRKPECADMLRRANNAWGASHGSDVADYVTGVMK
jgi:thymidylate synthase